MKARTLIPTFAATFAFAFALGAAHAGDSTAIHYSGHSEKACCKKHGTTEAKACCKKHDAGMHKSCCKKESAQDSTVKADSAKTK